MEIREWSTDKHTHAKADRSFIYSPELFAHYTSMHMSISYHIHTHAVDLALLSVFEEFAAELHQSGGSHVPCLCLCVCILHP